MKDWSPFSKVLLVSGVPALGYLSLTSPDDGMLASASTGQGIVAEDGSSQMATASGGAGNLQLPELELQPAFLIDQQTRLPGIDTFNAIVDYPLFVPTRSPFDYETTDFEPELEIVYAETEDTELDIRLVGTVLKSDQRVALITSPHGEEWQADGPLRVLREGDELKGWQVAKIGPESILFESDDERAEFAILK